MIPRVLHQVWIGSKPIPDRLAHYAQTWKAMHPDWTMRLWVELERVHPSVFKGPWSEFYAVPPLVNQHWHEVLPAYVGERAAVAARSDLIRYEVVAVHGGVYADLDVQVFSPIDALLPDSLRLFIADEYGPCPGNYLFGAAPGHPAMWRVVRDVGYNFFAVQPPVPTRWQRIRQKYLGGKPRPWFVDVLALTGPKYLFRQLSGHPECVIFPWQMFNPLHPRGNADEVDGWPASAYGNHHYAGTWYDQTKRTPPAWQKGATC